MFGGSLGNPRGLPYDAPHLEVIWLSTFSAFDTYASAVFHVWGSGLNALAVVAMIGRKL
jgi:hypothetical protein